MATEIERKFLVAGDAWRQPDAPYYSQGYLNSDKHRTVRVRLANGRGLLTVKGITTGISRAEFEYQIPVEDAHQLLALCEQPLIEKRRHIVAHGKHTWEVDEFLGDNAGLVVAEIELSSADEEYTKPDWLGEEVSGDARYFNSSLCQHPFKDWDK